MSVLCGGIDEYLSIAYVSSSDNTEKIELCFKMPNISINGAKKTWAK